MAKEKTTIRFRGVRRVVIAKIIEDTYEKYDTGEVIELMGINQVGKSQSTSSETYYLDNAAADTANAKGTTELTFTGSVLQNEVKALILGNGYDATTDGIIEIADNVPPYFAVGYVYGLTNGEEKLVWNYKGTFSVGDETYQTIDDSTNANEQTINYVGIDTVHKFAVPTASGGKENKNVRNYIGTLNETLTEEVFFENVLTPDKLPASSETNVSI